MMKTQTVQKKIIRENRRIDADGKTLGRLAGEIVKHLMGKNKVTYSMHQDNGDFVTVENVEKVKFTGTKITDKEYMHYSQYPGGLKRSALKDELEKNPARVLRRAVARMLPRNRQRDSRMHRLTIVGEKGTKRIW
jgi:large subunit ribosomal protein L13